MKKFFMLLFGFFTDNTCFVCEDTNVWWLFYFGVSLFNFDVLNLIFSIMARNFFLNTSICLHCREVFFDLNSKSSLPVSLSWFSCKNKWAFQHIRFTRLSIFSIILIRNDSLDWIGMFFNECLMSNFCMIRFITIKCSTNCNKKERGIISSSNILQINSALAKNRAISIIDCRKNQ